jgi:flagellar hook-associated protein 3 FlgL
MRVATFANSDRMLTASLRTQSRMAELQLQQASGSISTDYGGLGASARTLLLLEANMKTSEAYAGAASEASGRVEVMVSTLSTVTDLLTSFRSELTGAMSTSRSDTADASLIATAGTYLEELAGLLNVQFEGRYLFAGDATGTAPVDLDGYTATSDAANTSYYFGDAAVATVRIGSEQSVAYGVAADEVGFEQAFRALAQIAQASSLDDEALTQAYDLLVSAIEDIIVVQSRLASQAATIERSLERQDSYQALLETAISDLRDADVTVVAVKLASYETQLQASFSALAQVQSLSLLDYLR